MGITDAEHKETAPRASRLLISKLYCSLVGKVETVKIIPGTLAHGAYREEQVNEQFACNYGVNPGYRQRLQEGGLRISGIDVQGEVRIVELPGNRFFVGTLFLPQLLSRPDRPHPLIMAYTRTALSFQTAGHPPR